MARHTSRRSKRNPQAVYRSGGRWHVGGPEHIRKPTAFAVDIREGRYSTLGAGFGSKLKLRLLFKTGAAASKAFEQLKVALKYSVRSRHIGVLLMGKYGSEWFEVKTSRFKPTKRRTSRRAA